MEVLLLDQDVKSPTNEGDSLVELSYPLSCIVFNILWLSNTENSLLTHRKTPEILAPANGIENKFNSIRRLLFSTLVKILKQ